MVANVERWVRTVAPGAYLGNVWIELTVVAVVYTLLLLLFIRISRLGPHSHRVRRQMAAEAIGLLLYYRSPRAVMRHEARLIRANVRWLAYWLPALIAGGLLFALLWPALTDRYDYLPAPVGQAIVLRARLIAPERSGLDGDLDLDQMDVRGPTGAVQITARVRSAATGTVWTRLVPTQPGLLDLRLGAPGTPPVQLNAMQTGRPALPWHYRDGVELRIDYPRRTWWGLPHGWLVFLLAVCLATTALLARRLNVEW